MKKKNGIKSFNKNKGDHVHVFVAWHRHLDPNPPARRKKDLMSFVPAHTVSIVGVGFLSRALTLCPGVSERSQETLYDSIEKERERDFNSDSS